MIDCASFENFKSLKDVSIDLGRLTVLVGANGSGKSSVLQGIELVAKIAAPRDRDDTNVFRATSHFVDSFEARRIVTRGTHEPGSLRLRRAGDELCVIFVPYAVGSPSLERAYPWFDVEVRDETGELVADVRKNIVNTHRVGSFGSAAYLHLNVPLMVKTSVSDEVVPTMRYDGHNLASTLAWLAGARPEALAAITDQLAQIVPGVRRILIERDKVEERVIEKMEVDDQPVWRPVKRVRVGERFGLELDEVGLIPADLLSEGTVLALGLLTKLHEPSRPKLLLIDDIDRGLHIEAQARLVEVLRKLLASDPELQIVCTTHSPYFVSCMRPEEVRVLALDERRVTHARKLTEHPEYETWRFGTQAGELWAALGESWVTGAEAKP